MSVQDNLVYESNYVSPSNVLYYRIVVFAILTFTVISNRILRTLDGEPLANFRFFSIQNLHFLFFWFLFVLIWRNDEEKYSQLQGRLRGGLLSYTLVVTVVYYLLLFDGQDGGIDGFNDLVMHLFGTLFFVIDFILTQQEDFQWQYILSWLSYPFVFLVFSIIYDLLGGGPIYGFLTMDPLSSYITWVIILFSVFIIFGLIWIAISKILMKMNQR